MKRFLLKKTITTVACLAIIGSAGVVTAQQEIVKQNDREVNLQAQAAMVFPHTQEQAALIWAEALKQRSGAFRYAILANQLKEREYEKYHSMNWVIGGSSPHIISYTINEVNKIDDKTSEYEINYVMTDSTKTLYNSHENVTVKKLGQLWFVVKHEEYEYMPEFMEK